MLFEPETTFKSAVISDCGRYRYGLKRHYDRASWPITFVMLNPSTADASKDDPTIRKCLGFARRWNYGGIQILNLFAYRATAIKDMLAAADPIGPANDAMFDSLPNGADMIAEGWQSPAYVLAWGTHGGHLGRDRQIFDKLTAKSTGCLWCLGTTKDGHPKHPLYVPYSQSLVPFEIAPR